MPLPTLVTTAKVSVIVLASRVFNNKNIIALALIFFNLIDVPKFVILEIILNNNSGITIAKINANKSFRLLLNTNNVL